MSNKDYLLSSFEKGDKIIIEDKSFKVLKSRASAGADKDDNRIFFYELRVNEVKTDKLDETHVIREYKKPYKDKYKTNIEIESLITNEERYYNKEKIKKNIN